jgi:hypothetical protein
LIIGEAVEGVQRANVIDAHGDTASAIRDSNAVDWDGQHLAPERGSA